MERTALFGAGSSREADDLAAQEADQPATGPRSEITAHDAPRPGHGTSRTWQRTIAGKRYSFNAVLMPNGERRYFARQFEAGRDDLAARFACYWHPVLDWTVPAPVRIVVTGDPYRRWIGERGTIVPCPAQFAEYDQPGVVWAYMDFQADQHAEWPQYAKPLPVGLHAGEFVVDSDPGALAELDALITARDDDDVVQAPPAPGLVFGHPLAYWYREGA